MRKCEEAEQLRKALDVLRARREAGGITEVQHRIESARLLDRLTAVTKRRQRTALT